MGRLATAAALAATDWSLLRRCAPGAARAQTTPSRRSPTPTTSRSPTRCRGDGELLEAGRGLYRTGARSIDTIANAAMLTVFATAAAHGHVGPARNDPRARRDGQAAHRVAAVLTAPDPPYNDKMFHSPGWTSNMDGPYVDMDKSIDPKVAEGLQIAYRAARRARARRRRDRQRSATRSTRVSHVPFFRYPLVRLNQINWNAELYAYDCLVNGDPTLLRVDYRAPGACASWPASRSRWTRERRHQRRPELPLHYQNNARRSCSRNLDSAEYANMTLHFLYWYDAALKAGMTALPAEDRRAAARLGAARPLRLLDPRRLHELGHRLELRALDEGQGVGVRPAGAARDRHVAGVHARRASRGYAKYLFDRGLRLYEHMGPQPPGTARGARAPSCTASASRAAPATKMFWARMAANAVRAVVGRHGRMDGRRAAAVLRFDADIGRLAVCTPRYSTAILAVNRGKVPYGGIELARLYDADGDPIGGTGGRPPGAFGVLVTRPSDGACSPPRPACTRPERPPLTLRSPRAGRVDPQRVLATRPTPAPSSTSRSRDSTDNGANVTSPYAFHDRTIDAHWTSQPGEAKGQAQAQAAGQGERQVTFPTSGITAVAIEALMKNGTTVPVTGPVNLRTSPPVPAARRLRRLPRPPARRREGHHRGLAPRATRPTPAAGRRSRSCCRRSSTAAATSGHPRPDRRRRHSARPGLRRLGRRAHADADGHRGTDAYPHGMTRVHPVR